jgi:hypothetical protein
MTTSVSTGQPSAALWLSVSLVRPQDRNP